MQTDIQADARARTHAHTHKISKLTYLFLQIFIVKCQSTDIYLYSQSSLKLHFAAETLFVRRPLQGVSEIKITRSFMLLFFMYRQNPLIGFYTPLNGYGKIIRINKTPCRHSNSFRNKRGY